MAKNTHLLNWHMLQVHIGTVSMRQFQGASTTYVKVHIGIASMRQCQCAPTTYVTKIMETYFEIKHLTMSIMSIGFTSFKHLKLPHLKLPISTKGILVLIGSLRYNYIVNCLYLYDSYITKFDFMNYSTRVVVSVNRYHMS